MTAHKSTAVTLRSLLSTSKVAATTKRGKATTRTVKEVIKRGVLISFNPATYTASILILEATSTYLQNIPIANHMDGTSAVSGALCAVLFFDEQNLNDAVVLGIYPNGSQGIPLPAPGRVVFLTGFQQINGHTINSGVTFTQQISGNGSVPTGALGVIFSANFTSATTGTYIQIGPHGASLGNYQVLGNLYTSNGFINANGIVALDSNGQIDIKANNGNCAVSFYTQGYIQ